jgi:hypothetical protein
MDSYILEDINALLNLKKGDVTRLNHIKQICEANEIVSISDRKYIERLVTQYIRRTEPVEPKIQQKPKMVPIKESNISTHEDFEEKSSENQMFEKIQIPQSAKSEKTRLTPFELKNKTKILLGIAASVLAIILIVTVGIEFDVGNQVTEDSNMKKSETLPEFSLEIDESSYETADIISISGKVPSSSGTITLSIQNENGKTVWEENLSVKMNGEFSTLLIGGGSGWENSGKYLLRGVHNEITNEISFEFIAKK